jgi:hypothetical protein
VRRLQGVLWQLAWASQHPSGWSTEHPGARAASVTALPIQLLRCRPLLVQCGERPPHPLMVCCVQVPLELRCALNDNLTAWSGGTEGASGFPFAHTLSHALTRGSHAGLCLLVWSSDQRGGGGRPM